MRVLGSHKGTSLWFFKGTGNFPRTVLVALDLRNLVVHVRDPDLKNGRPFECLLELLSYVYATLKPYPARLPELLGEHVWGKR